MFVLQVCMHVCAAGMYACLCCRYWVLPPVWCLASFIPRHTRLLVLCVAACSALFFPFIFFYGTGVPMYVLQVLCVGGCLASFIPRHTPTGVFMHVCMYVLQVLCVGGCLVSFILRHTPTGVCMYVCVHVRTYVCLYVCRFVCMYVCMYVGLYVYISVFTYIQLYVCV